MTTPRAENLVGKIFCEIQVIKLVTFLCNLFQNSNSQNMSTLTLDNICKKNKKFIKLSQETDEVKDQTISHKPGMKIVRGIPWIYFFYCAFL